MAVKVISGGPAVDGGDIDISTNLGLARQFERVTYSIPTSRMPDILSFIQAELLPGITIGAKSLNLMSFFMYKNPFIYSGDEIFKFTESGEHGYYTINGTDILEETDPLYRFKFYVYMGINTMMLNGTIFSQLDRTHQELYDMLGIDTEVKINAGVHFIETSIGYIARPSVDIRLQEPLFWYLEPNTLSELFGGTVETVDTGYQGYGKIKFVSDITLNLNCFNKFYDSQDYKFTRSLGLDKKMLSYNIIDLKNSDFRKSNTWAVEYAMPWGFLTINNGLNHLDVSLSAPILLNRSVYNMLSAPLVPIVTTYRIRGGIFRDIGECIYVIFPCVERVR